MSKRFDPGRAVAMTWIVATVGSFFLLWPQMGFRGQAWLAANAFLCLFGAGWEMWQKERPRHPPPR